MFSPFLNVRGWLAGAIEQAGAPQEIVRGKPDGGRIRPDEERLPEVEEEKLLGNVLRWSHLPSHFGDHVALAQR